MKSVYISFNYIFSNLTFGKNLESNQDTRSTLVLLHFNSYGFLLYDISKDVVSPRAMPLKKIPQKLSLPTAGAIF